MKVQLLTNTGTPLITQPEMARYQVALGLLLTSLTLSLRKALPLRRGGQSSSNARSLIMLAFGLWNKTTIGWGRMATGQTILAT